MRTFRESPNYRRAVVLLITWFNRNTLLLTNQHPEIKKNLQSFPLISKFLPFLFRPILPLHLRTRHDKEEI